MPEERPKNCVIFINRVQERFPKIDRKGRY
jgi:hypothetical protein